MDQRRVMVLVARFAQVAVAEAAECDETLEGLRRRAVDRLISTDIEQDVASSALVVDSVLAGISMEFGHTRWVFARIKDGWTYGPQYDEERKTDPMMLPWDELPEEYRLSCRIFASVCKALKGPLGDLRLLVGQVGPRQRVVSGARQPRDEVIDSPP